MLIKPTFGGSAGFEEDGGHERVAVADSRGQQRAKKGYAHRARALGLAGTGTNI